MVIRAGLRYSGLAATASLAACMHTVAPPTVAARETGLAARAPAPPTPGRGDVHIDVLDGRARVDEVVDVREQRTIPGNAVAEHAMLPRTDEAPPGARSLTQTRFVCVTPCVARLASGPRELRFTLADEEQHAARFGFGYAHARLDLDPRMRTANTAVLDVVDGPAELRVALGRRREAPSSGFHFALLGTILSGSLATSGALVVAALGSSAGPSVSSVAYVTLGVGLAGTVGGTAAMVALRPMVQPLAFEYRPSTVGQ